MNEFKVYNIKNHALNATKQQELLRYTSDDFSGMCNDATTAFSVSNSKLVIANTLKFICDGVYFEFTAPDSYDIPVSGTRFYYIKGKFTDISSHNIESHNDNDLIAFKTTSDGEVSQVSISDYKVEKTVTTGDTSITYEVDLGKQTVMTINGDSITYIGQTLYKGDYFYIPLCYWNGTKLETLVFSRDKSTFEDWLSANAVAALKSESDSTYTHQSGSTAEHPTWGTIGNYNIVGNTIKNNNNNFITVASTGSCTYHNADDGTKAIYTQNKVITSGTLPIEAGGTNATTPIAAKQNLRIFYGQSNPLKDAIVVDSNIGAITPQAGDIYFKLV